MDWRRLIGLVVFGLAALATNAPAQQGETRIALIIANEVYAGGNFQSLPGTQADAAIMRPALERAGFAVTVRSNLSRQQMREALADFARQLAALGSRGVGFLYYSGHGVGQRGENFLIPVDARVQSVTDLPLAGVPLSEQLEALQLAQVRSVIIVLDACRTAFGRGSRGLAPVPARTDTLIAFSTQPNELAADDGLYARVLAEEISRPGADTITAFARVTASVANATGRAQVPRYDNGLIEPVVFVADTGSPASPPLSTAGAAPAMQPEPGTFVGRWVLLPGASGRCNRNVEIISLPPNMLVREWDGDRPPTRAFPYSTIHASDTTIVAEFAEGATSFNLQGDRLQISYRLKGECAYTRAPG